MRNRGSQDNPLNANPSAQSFAAGLQQIANQQYLNANLPPAVRSNPPSSNLAFNQINLRQILDSQPKRGTELFNQFYSGLENSFPDPNECFPKGVVKQQLKNDPNKHVTLLTIEDIVIGSCCWSFFLNDTYPAGMIDHICIENDFRGQPHNLGVRLLNSVLEKLKSMGARAIVAEVNDPHAMNKRQIQLDQDSGIDPATRIRWWDRQGFKALDIQYTQPALATGLEPVDYILLAVKVLNEEQPTTLSSVDLFKILETDSRSIDPNGNFLESATYKKIEQTLMEQEQIPLIDLDQKRSYLLSD